MEVLFYQSVTSRRICVGMVWALLIGWVCCPGAAGATETIDLESLLEEMVDREELARRAVPGYSCGQFSSYDRGSQAPGEASWWDNRDRSHFLRIEENPGRREHVLMDAEGPGAVVRIWGTWHGPKGKPFSNGPLRVYLDHRKEPVLEAPITEFIDGGYLAGPPLSQGVAPETDYRRRGHNLYLPIPYAGHCKITYETKSFIDVGGVEGEALYYQINYRTYEKGTKVASFSLDELGKTRDTIRRVEAMLRSPYYHHDRLTGDALEGKLEAGQSRALELTGQRSIRSIRIQLKAQHLSQALRSTVLEIDFDGKQTVWCPVGDFFGVGYEIHPYTTWFTHVNEGGFMSCFWVMPFREKAAVRLINYGDEPVTVREANVMTGPWEWDERSLYFHAGWKQWSNIRTHTHPADPDHGAQDLNWITLEGSGKYVGDVLSLYNGAPKWWGEGDEKIYIDGESFPSHFGTGTEDYYGYAWCRPAAFSAPFHAQPWGEGNQAGGFSANCRFRVLDAIPFRESLRFDMELWHWVETDMDYAPTMFWYGRKTTSDNLEPAPAEVCHPVRTEPPVTRVQKRLKDALEGEDMDVVRQDGGVTMVQRHEHFGWSWDKQLWWKEAAVGDTLIIEFDSDREGRAMVYAGLTKARDYGIVRLELNGEVVREKLDLYNPTVVSVDMPLGRVPVKKEGNRLKVIILGANSKAIPQHMFGLDYLMLKEQP